MAEQSQLSVFLLKMHFLAKFANRASATLYYYYHVSEKNARLVSLCIYWITKQHNNYSNDLYIWWSHDLP